MARKPQELIEAVNAKIEKIAKDIAEEVMVDIDKTIEEGEIEFWCTGQIKWKGFLWENVNFPEEHIAVIDAAKVKAKIILLERLQEEGWTMETRKAGENSRAVFIVKK